MRKIKYSDPDVLAMGELTDDIIWLDITDPHSDMTRATLNKRTRIIGKKGAKVYLLKETDGTLERVADGWYLSYAHYGWCMEEKEDADFIKILKDKRPSAEVKKIHAEYTEKLQKLRIKSRQGCKTSAVDIMKTMTERNWALREHGWMVPDSGSELIPFVARKLDPEIEILKEAYNKLQNEIKLKNDQVLCHKRSPRPSAGNSRV